jgi:hypothetical protein
MFTIFSCHSSTGAIWVLDEFRFWTEQYLLQAFLTFNSEFEVLMGNSYLAHRYLEDFKATFTNSPWWGGGSFWMRRRSPKAGESLRSALR